MLHFSGTAYAARLEFELGRTTKLTAICGDLTARNRAPREGTVYLLPVGPA